jgi:hypothetical protein
VKTIPKMTMSVIAVPLRVVALDASGAVLPNIPLMIDVNGPQNVFTRENLEQFADPSITPTTPTSVRFRIRTDDRKCRHLTREFPAIWSFLFDPSLDATNWRAEQALRPVILTRKVCGGNRSWNRADSQQILASVIRTTSQRRLNPHAIIASLLQAPTPQLAVETN